MTQSLKFFDPPPVRYFGSKWQLADWIIGQFPPHVSYVEPFCGGASIFFRKEPSGLEVLNDLNGDVVNFFEVLRRRTDELVREVDLTPFARTEYERSFEPCDDPLERARRFYVRSWQAFGSGGIAKPTGWRHQLNMNRGTGVAKEWSRLGGLYLGAQRLKAAQIECRDVLEIIERYDTEDTLFYIDPPYVLSARERKYERYVHEFSDDQHRQLANALHQVAGMVLLSGYQCPLYEELYGDWHVSTKTNTTNGNSTSIEYLWSNPNATDLARLPLFAQEPTP